MNPPPPTPEQYQRIALYSFLASAPLLVGATMVVNGSTELWEALGIKTAQAQVNYTGPSGWTNNPNAGYSVTTPPPAPTTPPWEEDDWQADSCDGDCSSGDDDDS